MKKRTIALLLGIVMVFCLSACGGGETAQAEDSAEETEQTEVEEQAEQDKTEYKIGETWMVEGLWSLTVDGVTEVDDRNEYFDKEPAAVYLVDYTYTNIGFEDETGYLDGLYISLEESVVDNAGFMGYSYPGDVINYPQETPVGATCKAQACIGVDNAGSFKLNYSVYDTDGTKYAATFVIDVE